VMGSGTVLDSARLRHLISITAGVDVHNVHGYVLGEHGDSEFVAWSMTHIAGMHIDQYCPICGKCSDWQAQRERIEQQVRDSAYHIIGYKGATSFGVGLALVRIAGAILRGQSSVLTVSTMLAGQFGVDDVCLGVPCIVSSSGVAKIVDRRLPLGEQHSLDASAETLRQAYAQIS
jgi:L-lactate dehydrogenase